MRTTLAATAVLALALAVGAASLLVLVRRALLHDLDETAELRTTDIAALAGRGDLPPTFAGVEGDDEALVQVVDRNGRVLTASAPLAGRGPVSALDPGTEHILSTTDEGLRIGNRQGFRVAALEVQSPEGPRTVYVLSSLVLFHESVHTVRRSILIGIPLLIVVVGGVTWLFVGRALQPVEVIRKRVRRISEASLAERVPVPPTNDEVARLASTMNEMLARLEASSTRQRQFVADASHELRTPLAAATADLEVALGQPTRTDWPATAEDVLAQLRRLERLQHDLLFLARTGDGNARPPSVPMDLDDVVLEEVSRLRVPDGVRVDATAVSGACVQGRRGELARVVRNLLDNAGRFARSEVRVSLGEHGGVARLVVEDDGPGIPEAARAHIFDRFTKVDESREDGGGAGLGLAIVAEIVRAHGGSVAVGSAAPGARVVVTLPASGHADPVPAPLSQRAPEEDEREEAGAQRGA
jgi:signal transduction histidine kinase